MKYIDDIGGPAFPAEFMARSPFKESEAMIEAHSPGMSLLDYFAAKAMQGELASQSAETGEWLESSHKALAEKSYKIADAMLAARELP